MKTKFRVFDRGTGHFLQPEINGVPFIVTQDGEAYMLELKHPDFVLCEYAGKDRRGVNVYEGDIVQVRNRDNVITNRNVITKDKVSGEFHVLDHAPFPCKTPMTAVTQFYDVVGNALTKVGPQQPIYESDVVG